jgi:hypothetical protein
MDTRELIYFIVRVAWSVFMGASFLYSLYVGVRYGFRFPRSLHIMAVVIVMLEAGVLVVYPLRLSSITAVLGSILAILPFSPYIGWAIGGGPIRLNERCSHRVQPRAAPNDDPAGRLGTTKATEGPPSAT